MTHILRAADRNLTTSRTIKFEGGAYGTPISFFAVDNETGQGPGLHTHPYAETWVVRRGRAEVVIGDERFEVGPGDIAVAPANTPHKFTNLGPDRLDIVCIHAAGAIEQADLE
ncbi:Cupin domain-containing protein [Devosia lucknowensis]|uniref:Cupin domain-containing protein n=1 Tax=Devosia lucknowensis TaxID=1096929 RepID=A0A1Y6E8M9_9HYPH|nr:cupin domain-containing protein [Devosia lucknowensis]SMQ58967.1 Cupin domain-containing protein [Devosia lucknowensis]